jgi:glycosyltransferase involved in cell wall biosynthesis
MLTVTVIIPTYNRGYIVRRAIDNTLAQSFPDFEIIVVDDGSTDNTHMVIESVRDARIKYIYKPNGGVSSARNVGMAKANGEYITFLDSDDIWPENYLFIMVNSLRNNPDYGLAYCLFLTKSTNGIVHNHNDIKRRYSGIITDKLFGSAIPPGAAIFKKNILNDIYFDTQLKIYEDADFFLRLSVKTKYLFVDDIRIIRTLSNDSLSRSAGTNCSGILVLERFYLNLGGNKFISKKTAFKKLSRACRRVARRTQEE